MEQRPENLKPVNFLHSLINSPDLLSLISKVESNPPSTHDEREKTLDELYSLIDADYVCGESWISGKFHLYDSEDKRIYGVDETTLNNEPSIFQGLDVTEVNGVDRVVFIFDATDELDDDYLQGYATTLEQITQFHALSTEAYEKPIQGELDDIKYRAKGIYNLASGLDYRRVDESNAAIVDSGLDCIDQELKQRFSGSVEIETTDLFLLSQSSTESFDWSEAFIDQSDPERDDDDILPNGRISGVIVPKLHPAFNEFTSLPRRLEELAAWPHMVVRGDDGDSLFIVSVNSLKDITGLGMNQGENYE